MRRLPTQAGPLALAGLLALPAAAHAAGLDLDALLRRLAHPAPATTPFIEARFSRLLARPLVVSGQMEYLGPDALARTVQQPFRERTDIKGDSVTVQRDTARPQTFSLQRAPELKLLLSSFTALLGGDRQALEQQFRLEGEGDARHWTLRLTPLDPRLHDRIRGIEVRGANGEPRCITTTESNGTRTVTLLADAARVTPPRDADRAWLDARCAVDSPPGP